MENVKLSRNSGIFISKFLICGISSSANKNLHFCYQLELLGFYQIHSRTISLFNFFLSIHYLLTVLNS